MPGLRASFRQNAVRAAFASGAVEALTRAMTIVLSIATARALEPREVGVLGLGVIVVGVLSIITACAETAGVVGRSKETDPRYAWAAMVIRAMATAGVLILTPLFLPALARLLASEQSAELITLVHLLLWQLVLDLGATYPRVLLQRRLRLTALAGANLLQITAHVGLSLVLLRLGYDAKGIVVAALLAGGMSAAYLWVRLFTCPDPRWDTRPSTDLVKQVATSTARVLAGSFVGYLNGRLDNLLVAGVLGPAAMSFYGMAWSASRIPFWILSQALGAVLVPTLSQVGTDTPRIGRILRESLRHTYVLLVPACVFLFVAAEPLVTVMLGSKWLPVVSALQVMSLSILLAPPIVAFNAFLVATDRAHMTGLATGAQLATITLFVVPLASRWGLIGAAVGDLVSTGVLAAVLYALCRMRVPGIGWEVVRAACLPFMAAVPVGLIVSRLATELPVGVIGLAGEACLSLVGYLIVLSLLGGLGRLMELAILARDIVRGSPPTLVAPAHASGSDR